MMGLGSNGCFVTGAPYLNGGHGYGFSSSVGHLGSDSVSFLIYDSMRTYSRHQCCIIGPSRNRQLCHKGVNILGRYMTLVISIYILHTSPSCSMKVYSDACDFNLK
jgi:hypothetical protein